MELIQIVLLVIIGAMVWEQLHPGSLIRRKSSRKVILDTCALIDGRITELSHSGFVPDELIIPEFVIHELQLLADGTDPHKRERARYGLDVVQELQDSRSCTVVINRLPIPEKHEVDDKLVALAKKLKAMLYTTDYNLNKVAEIEGIQVLNVNELAQQLRPSAIPGEKMKVKIVQKGSNPQQGVGYLDDGTMLVVEGAAKMIGETISAEITRTHQTVAGKMLFGQVKDVEIKKVAPKKPLAARLKRTRNINRKIS